MRIITRGRYAVRAMLDLALNCAERSVSLREISERQEISIDYVERKGEKK